MPADDALDRELAERARERELARKQALAKHRAKQAAIDALREREDEARRRDAQEGWNASQELRQWAARKLADARFPSRHLIVRSHMAEEKKLFGKGKLVHVIDEAVDGWLIQDGEIRYSEGKDVWERWNGWTGKLSNDSPMTWRSTYLLPDSGLAITFVDVTKVNRYWFTYYHDENGIPSPGSVERQVRVIRSAGQLTEFAKADPLYRMPSKDYFLGRVEEATLGH